MEAAKPPSGSRRARPATALRADAERNRERIVRAARRLYASEGLRISMSAVAREAGVGKATLFRHFTSPQELIDAVFADRMDAYVQASAEALAENDPWYGFVRYIWAICEMQALDRGFADVLTLTFPTGGAVEDLRAKAYDGFLEIIARAKATGHLRGDFESEDLVLLLMANAGVISATANDAPDSWRRLVGQILRGYASTDAPLPPMPPAPSSHDLYRAMTRASSRKQP
ncbi:MAG: TetR/AcrR family transcriptional regulator [Acidimicrobiales bacterium]